ncbi:MAG: hypothetical protein H7833_20965, partial [Magnetococcus sp. DMHC-1]
DVLDLVTAGRLTEGHARALLGLEGSAHVTEVAAAVAEAGLSVRETERRVRELVSHVAQSVVDENEKKKRGNKRRDPALALLEKKLASELRTKVTITQVRGRGKVILEFVSLQDMKELIGRLVPLGDREEEKTP